jgi:hypothetical protein
MHELRVTAAPQVDHRSDEQHQIDERDARQQHGSHPAPPQQVARRETGEDDDPEADFAGDDDRVHHGVLQHTRARHRSVRRPPLGRGTIRLYE